MKTQNLKHLWDAIVIGASAAGLSAALMLGRARRRVLVLDAGLPRNRFADHMHGVLGHEGKTPAELTQLGRQEAASYGVEFVSAVVAEVTTEVTTEVHNSTAGLQVRSEAGTTYTTRSLLVATGITDVLPDIPGLAQRWGSSVLHCPYCHGWEVADQRLGILATSPASLHLAQMVRQWSDQVTLFTGAITPIAEETTRRLQSRGIKIIESAVGEVLETDSAKCQVLLTDGQAVDLDAIFTAGTPKPHDDFLQPLRLERQTFSLDMGSFLKVDQAGRTSNPRIWAAGNVVNPMANVPLAMGAGSLAGGAVNGFLVEEDFNLALKSSIE